MWQAKSVIFLHLYSFSFYRATLCVSWVFAVVRCMSVCPSVCHVGVLYHTTEDIVKHLVGLVITLVFFRPMRR